MHADFCINLFPSLGSGLRGGLGQLIPSYVSICVKVSTVFQWPETFCGLPSGCSAASAAACFVWLKELALYRAYTPSERDLVSGGLAVIQLGFEGFVC